MHNSLQFAQQLLKTRIQPGDLVVDATAGNGHDTLFMAGLVGDRGTVYSYDIQAAAIEATRVKLEAANLLHRVQLIQRGHETMERELAPANYVKAVMFNTGYLPGSDHQVTTQPTTTLQALTIALRYLAPRGIITIVTYYGHPGGAQELADLNSFLQGLEQQQFDVLQYHFINQENQPPILFAIEKKARHSSG